MRDEKNPGEDNLALALDEVGEVDENAINEGDLDAQLSAYGLKGDSDSEPPELGQDALTLNVGSDSKDSV
jgi:hypothetical protein